MSMNLFIEITKSNINEYLQNYNIVACRIRNSRIKAKQIAILEIIFSQFDNEVLAITNGPLGDIQGIITFFCPKEKFDSFNEKLFGIGYCDKFYLLDFEDENGMNHTDIKSINPLVWKGKKFSIKNLYSQSSKIYEEQSPHNREFKIDSNGEEKTVIGYRGDGSELGRRSLPVEDARCMVNLAIPGKHKRMLDPFAGAGGILHAFKYTVPDGAMTSIDIDPVLKPGLEFFGSTHYVKNAAHASFPENSFNAIITEVPFSKNADDDIIRAFSNLNPAVSDNGIFVIMCEKNQTAMIHKTMSELKNWLLFSHAVNRKGMDVEISVWTKDKDFSGSMELTLAALKKIH